MQLKGWANIAAHYNRQEVTVRGWIKDRDGNIKEGCPVFVLKRAHVLETESFEPWLDDNVKGWRHHTSKQTGKLSISGAQERRNNRQRKLICNFRKRIFKLIPEMTPSQSANISIDFAELITNITRIK